MVNINRIGMRVAYGTTYNHDISINYPATVTTYEPYTNTVYSGTIDIVSGVLRVDKAKAVLNDASKWAAATGTVDFDYNVDFTDRKKYSDSYTGLSCSYIRISSQWTNTGRWRGATSVVFGIKSDVLTLEQIKSDATAGKIEICYDLAQPLTFQLTPQEVMSLVGHNVVFSPDGSVTVRV